MSEPLEPTKVRNVAHATAAVILGRIPGKSWPGAVGRRDQISIPGIADVHCLRLLGSSQNARIIGTLTTGASDEEIHQAINKVRNGQDYVQHDLALNIILHQVESSRRLSALTTRELDVLRQLGAGKRIKDISADLGIEPKVGPAICSSLRHKLKLDSTSALVEFARMILMWPILAR